MLAIGMGVEVPLDWVVDTPVPGWTTLSRIPDTMATPIVPLVY